MIQASIAKQRKQRRRTPREYTVREYTARWSSVINDNHEKIEKIHNEDDDASESDCKSEDSENDIVHHSDEIWLNEEEIAEFHNAQEKCILNTSACQQDDEWP